MSQVMVDAAPVQIEFLSLSVQLLLVQNTKPISVLLWEEVVVLVV